MEVRDWRNGKVLENGNLKIKPGNSVAVENLTCYISKRKDVSSIFSILVRRAWKNYPCSPKDHLSMVVGKLFMQIWLYFHSSWFCLWRHRRWRFFVSFDERTVVGVLWLPLVGSSTNTTSNLHLLCKAFEDRLPADAFWSETMKEHFLRHFSLGICEGNCWTWMDFLQSCFQFLFSFPFNW